MNNEAHKKGFGKKQPSLLLMQETTKPPLISYIDSAKQYFECKYALQADWGFERR